MTDQILHIINRIQEAANQIRTSNNLMHETLHGIADDLEAAIAPQWVPVAERLPEVGTEVYVVIKGYDTVERARCDGSGWHTCGFYTENEITHWHEIDYPEPPPANNTGLPQ